MIDRDELAKAYKSAALTCAAVATIPLLLAYVAYVISTSSEAAVEPVDPLILVIFGLLAVSPFVTSQLVRRQASSPAIWARGQKPEVLMTTFAVTEFALWEISSLLGFVAFVLGAPLLYFGACIALSYIGYAISFPRWSTWIDRAQQLEQSGMAGTIIPG